MLILGSAAASSDRICAAEEPRICMRGVSHDGQWRALVPAGVEERFVTVGGWRMRYLTCGEGSPLLLVHGLMGYSFSWTEVITDLGQHFRVIAPDLLNLGLSARADVSPHLEAMAERVHAFSDALGVGSQHVIASSHGGAIALQMAIAAPHRVRGLVLVAPPHPWSERSRWQIRLFGSFLGAPLARLMAVAPSMWMWFGLRRLYAQAARMRPGTVAGYSRPMEDARSLAFLLKVARAWKVDFARVERVITRLRDRRMLLVWGDRDRIVPLTTAAELQTHLPRAILTVIPDCGHLPYEERPAEFLSAVTDFLRQEDSRGA